MRFMSPYVPPSMKFAVKRRRTLIGSAIDVDSAAVAAPTEPCEEHGTSCRKAGSVRD